jgi:D-alanyl-D-alanine-carboxypeptidase/D-alanyl-D-alanine-endopeptidase
MKRRTADRKAVRLEDAVPPPPSVGSSAVKDVSDAGDPWLTGVLREAFSPLADEDSWQLAAVAIAGERTSAWLSGGSMTSSFQIGSVTKTFTALLLATMAAKGQVALEDPVSRYLPAAAGSGTRLVDLATHTSGYPRIPRGVRARMLLRLRDPYALVRDRHVDRSLRKLSRKVTPGPHPFEYSNFGYGVLSRALAVAGGLPFGELLRQEVLAPLDLEEVTLETDPDPDKRRLFGHNASVGEMEHWHNPALQGASFLFSSIEGMRRYLAANVFPETTSLRVPLDLVHEARNPAGPGTQVALGWLLRSTDDGPVHWHNGGTAGFGSFIGFDLERKLGVAALISRVHTAQMDEAAIRVLSELRKNQ